MKRIVYSGILAAAAFAVALDNARAQSNVYSLNVVAGIQVGPPRETHFLFIGPESSRFGLQTELTYSWPGQNSKASYTSFSLDFIHTSEDSSGFVWNSTRLATFSRGPFRLSLNPWLATPILLLISARLWIVFFRDRRQKLQPAIPMAN